MYFDNWSLPYTSEDDDRSRTLQNLALYFINLHCHKKLIDEDFRINHPPRLRLDDEPFDEYDGYLTAHNNAYRAMLENQGLNYLAESDVYFWEKVSSVTYGKDLLQIHPVLFPREINEVNLTPMLCALLIYGFTGVLKAQNLTFSSLQNERKNILLRHASDALLVAKSFFGDEQNIMAQLVVTQNLKPTFLSKIAKTLFLKRKISSWPSIIKYLQG